MGTIDSKILKASAGTGKTYRLSIEYIAAIMQGKEFSEIVILTFTRKATAEVRERVFEQIADILKKKEESGVWKSLKDIYPELDLDLGSLEDTYREMLMEKDLINIYTIDSFLNLLFEEIVAPYLGIFKYEIISDKENQRIIDELFRRFISSPEKVNMVEKLIGKQISRDFQVPVDFLNEVIHNRWKYLLIDHSDDTSGSDRYNLDFIKPLDEVLELMDESASITGDEVDGGWFTKAYRDIMTYYLELKASNADKNLLEDCIYKHYSQFLKDDTCWNGNKFRKKELKPYKAELKEAYQVFQERLAGKIMEAEVLPQQDCIFELVNEIFAEYDRLKLKQKRFTHQDISNFTYNYLIEEGIDLPSGQLIDYLGELVGGRISTIFIDEFQDTSVLQWQILNNLLTGERSLIAVGDAKQSIYGWRDGEKELFIRLPEITAGVEETLGVCYRSRENIVEFVNGFFNDLRDDWEYENVDFLSEKEGGYLEVLVGGSSALINTDTKKFAGYSEEKQNQLIRYNEKVTENLPAAIARRIDQEFEDYSGIAVLARKNSELEEIGRELEELEIPYILEKGGSLLEHKAVRPLYQLLLYLSRDDFYQLIAFLRSEPLAIGHELCQKLIKYSEDFQIYLKDKGQLSFEVGGILAVEPKLAELFGWIKRLRELPYPQLVENLLKESGVATYYKDNRSALKNLYKFSGLLKSVASLGELIEYLDDKEGASELEQEAVKSENAVELLTVHRAKGLSFDTEFFYWSPGGNGGGNQGNTIELFLEFDRLYQKVENYLLLTSNYNNLLQWLDYDFQDKADADELAEEINNLYVALTRPVDNLFLYIDTPRKIMPGGNDFWESNDSYNFYEPAILKATGQDSLADLIEPWSYGELVVDSFKEEAQILAETENLAAFFKGDWPEESARIRAREAKDFDFNLDKERAQVVGLGLHFYMEQVLYGGKAEKEHAARLVMSRYGNILGRTDTEKLIARAEAFVADNPEYFSKEYDILTEYSLWLDDGSMKRVDRLLVDRENKLVKIIDFKSGGIESDDQLDEYKEILAEELGQEYSFETEYVNI
ncbi:UvrD-helicase domain-containing protein [Halanaerobiaceae bacterium Z-7014]|uniref:DNA 3'-5' helicase n=1 Tax=Halonatronomonas betaini TaxID=2778430 RepID=A0A931F7C9_9FIRM|nr:UvrD-helicase domain-containing protein [Halonatronomonas betaini]MBF8437815.1 UvrD-helicase domain-containing protein [Halonatronomonas betaini]